MLAGLAISLWLAGDRDAAVTSYRRLSNAAKYNDWTNPETVAESDLNDAEKKPLEAVCAETLKRHPELQRKP